MNHGLKPKEHSARVKLSLAACALVMAASAADADMKLVEPTGQVEAAVLTKIRAYCIRSWQNAGIQRQDWEDCTQDVFFRVLSNLTPSEIKIAITDREATERRELNRAIWATAQRWRRAVRHSSIVDDDARATTDDPWPERMQAVEQVHEAVVSEAANLSGTQQEIVDRWSNGESIATIAATLKMSPARVSDEKYNALQKLRTYLGVNA